MFNWLASAIRGAAIRRAVRNDTWLREMTEHIRDQMGDPTQSGGNPWIEEFQTLDPSGRKLIMEQLAKRVVAIQQSEDRVVACRGWIQSIGYEHGILTSLFSAHDNPNLHPCQRGLIDHLDSVITDERVLDGCYYREYRRLGSVELAREALRILSCRLIAEINMANYGRILLRDLDENRRDWLKPYLQALSAHAEDSIRTTLGLETYGNTTHLFIEYFTIEDNLMRGYRDPLENVSFAVDRP